MRGAFSECQLPAPMAKANRLCRSLHRAVQDHLTTTVKAASFTARTQGTPFLHKAWPTKASGAVPVPRARNRQTHVFPQAYPAGVCISNAPAG